MFTGDLVKVNGDFPFTDNLQTYSINKRWVEQFPALWELLSGCTEEIGQTFYEHISNYVQNIRDIDLCGLHQLYSIAKELNVDHLFSYDLAYPSELEEIMNTLSVSRSYLLTSGYILHDDTLASVWSSLSAPYTHVEYYSGGLTGQIATSGDFDTSAVITAQILPDMSANVFLTGFIEAVISANLVTNANWSMFGPNSGIALDYQGFMDDIYSDPQSTYNSSTSAVIIEEVTHTLRNIAIRASYQRDTLKNIAQKHAMIGTNTAIEKIFGEYISKSFTKQSDWRLWTPSGSLFEQALPSIVNNDTRLGQFGVNVIEYFDNTEYMNISASSPLVCGLIGWSEVQTTTSSIDISGNIVTGIVTQNVPVYGTGLCGYMVTGGNPRFWEGSDLQDAILVSEHTSGEVSSFYYNLGVSGQSLSDYWNLQSAIWSTFAPSGLDRYSVLSELTGTPSEAYSLCSMDQIPSSGWVIPPTSLSGAHWKYMGTVTGDVPPSNYKNQLYPTTAPHPFIWNLVKKTYESFPDILDSLLMTQISETHGLSSQVDASGNIIDSWKIRNHEFIGYQTFYEQSNNIDFNGNENSEIDRDGSFHVDALSAFILSADMTPYYSHISKNFAVSGITTKIDAQLSAFRPDVIALSGHHIFNYQVDQYNNHYMLYKDSDSSMATGTLWMRFRNHPLPFPLCSNAESASAYELQQLYCRGGMGLQLNSIFNGGALDFGFYDNIMWVAGAVGERIYPFITEDDEEFFTEDEIALETDDNEYAEKLIVFQNDYIYFPLTIDPGPSDETVFSVVFKGSQYPQELPNFDEYDNFVGIYSYEPYIVFVHVISAPESNSVMFKFKHYDKYKYKFIDIPTDAVTITDANIQPLHAPLNSEFRKLWHLASSENWVHIAYEGVNSLSGEFANSIVTIDIDKSTLNGATAVVNEWTNFLDYS